MEDLTFRISGFPNELLHEIFSLCLATHRDAPFGSIRLTSMISILDVNQHPSWVLSHVCQQWRNLVVSTPQFWTRMHIIVTKPVMSSASSHLVHLILSHTKSLPLQVYFIDSSACGLGESTALSDLFAQCYRWETFSLYGSLRGLNHTVTGNLSSLTAVVLRQVVGPMMRGKQAADFVYLDSIRHGADDGIPEYRYDRDDDFDDDVPAASAFDGFLSAPKLTSLSLETLPHFIDYKLPWAMLTNACWSDQSHNLEHTAAVLPKLSSLKIAVLRLRGYGTPALLESPTLQDLTLEYTGHSGLILAAIRMSCLEELHISGYPMQDLCRSMDDSSFGMSHACAMTEGALRALDPSTGKSLGALDVTITGETPIHLAGFVALLQSIPSITTLHVRFPGFNSCDAYCQSLHAVAGASVLVPAVTRLRLSCGGGFEAGPILISMIQSRRQPRTLECDVAVLERVDLHLVIFTDSGVMDSAEQAFKALLEEGMEGGMTTRFVDM